MKKKGTTLLKEDQKSKDRYFVLTNNPQYLHLNVGYRIPLKDAPGLNYPGHARIIAPQIGYQRFWWKGAYTSLYALNAFEKYFDQHKKKIGNGFTLYLDFYLGYQFTFFKNRFFFEPAIGISYWPLRTNVPASFKAVEQKWPNSFIQPGLDFGFKF